jgi:hypothetical protein
MKRIFVTLVLIGLVCTACGSDRVRLARGSLGPAHYEVEVRATGASVGLHTFRRADLLVHAEPQGAVFRLRAAGGVAISADVLLGPDGSVFLERVRGAGSGVEADLASLVGQLSPSLPKRPVRLGEHWSSSQRINTSSLETSLHTVFHIVRFRRLAGQDTADFAGDISGRVRTTNPRGTFSGTLVGHTEVAWSVRAGRVVMAQTSLVWTIVNAGRVTLDTVVRPRS